MSLSRPWHNVKPVKFNGERHILFTYDRYRNKIEVGDIVIATQWSTPYYAQVKSILRKNSNGLWPWARVGLVSLWPPTVHPYSPKMSPHNYNFYGPPKKWYRTSYSLIKVDLTLEEVEEKIDTIFKDYDLEER